MKTELLSPAANLEVAKAAINAGADAVYMGGPAFGARSKASNSLQDLEAAVKYAHLYGARVFLTLNTLVYDREMPDAVELAFRASEIGVDAILLQDLRLLPFLRVTVSGGGQGVPFGGTLSLNASERVHLAPPPDAIEVHASTQCHIDSVEKALYLESLGFKRLVLARELSLPEIAAIKRALKPETEIETFIHGALCVCYSGQCYMSAYLNGRSGNRGDCAQSCRLPYDLVNECGRVLVKDRHLLSIKDLNADAYLEELVNLGVSCLKIEGRLKDADYVKNVTLYYRRRLDKILSGRPDYEPASHGTVQTDFIPDIDKTFHREYCTFNLSGERGDWAVWETPKATGERVGRIKRVVYDRPGEYSGLCLEIEPVSNVDFTPGDGLCYIDAGGYLQGFSLERVEGDRLYGARVSGAASYAEGVLKKCGSGGPHSMAGRGIGGSHSIGLLFRNRNIAFEKKLRAAVFQRTLAVEAAFDADTFTFTFKDECGREASHTVETALFQRAKNPETARENFARQLGKLGGTAYRLTRFEYLGDEALFLPAFALNAVRRELVRQLEANAYGSPVKGVDTGRKVRAPYGVRVSGPVSYAEDASKKCGPGGPHAITPKQSIQPIPGEPLMVCKYCLRAQLGQCLKKDKPEPSYKGDLFLRGARHKFALKFDCASCRMEVYACNE